LRKFEEQDPRARDVTREFEDAEKAREIDLHAAEDGEVATGDAAADVASSATRDAADSASSGAIDTAPEAGPEVEPTFENLSQEEIDAAFEEAESGTHMELPGKNPVTGEGLQRTKIKFNEDKPIPHHDNMEFEGIKDTPGNTVQVRRHSANPNAPDGSYSQENPTTQIDSGNKYRLPDGTWKTIKEMTPEERAGHSTHESAGSARLGDLTRTANGAMG
jgi:hypothetical protein